MSNIGLQLYSVRDAVQADLLGTLEKVAQMGYSAAQFAGFAGEKAEDVKKKLDELNLKVAGAHVQENLFESDLDQILKYHETIGNDLLIIPWLPESMRTTKDDYKRTAEMLDAVGQKLFERGFRLGYHNHDFEFAQFNDQTGIDLLFENTDANHLKMELDCFWASYTKNDPIQIIKKYSNRCVSLHIKDLKIENGSPISTELGTGTLPLLEYMKKGKEVGVKNFIVEQENFTKDPLYSARNNAEAMVQFKNLL